MEPSPGLGVGSSEEEEFEYRVIQPGDYETIKSLHEEFFPVRYSDKFFRDACVGIGFRGGELFFEFVGFFQGIVQCCL